MLGRPWRRGVVASRQAQLEPIRARVVADNVEVYFLLQIRQKSPIIQRRAAKASANASGSSSTTLTPRSGLAANDLEHFGVHTNRSVWTDHQGRQLSDPYLTLDVVIAHMQGDYITGCGVEGGGLGGAALPDA